MISRFFIDRPVLANVLALVFVLIGLVALLRLPTAQYPNVVPPTIQVKTLYPGASAKTLIDTVALPIEQSVNGVEDITHLQGLGGVLYVLRGRAIVDVLTRIVGARMLEDAEQTHE